VTGRDLVASSTKRKHNRSDSAQSMLQRPHKTQVVARGLTLILGGYLGNGAVAVGCHTSVLAATVAWKETATSGDCSVSGNGDQFPAAIENSRTRVKRAKSRRFRGRIGERVWDSARIRSRSPLSRYNRLNLV
jgi:hypothetical protein